MTGGYSSNVDRVFHFFADGELRRRNLRCERRENLDPFLCCAALVLDVGSFVASEGRLKRVPTVLSGCDRSGEVVVASDV